MHLPADDIALPRDVRAFLREADCRIARFQTNRHVPGFVPSDFVRTYQVLHALSAGEMLRGNLFCEWGSGFGVVACLAAMLDFDACGIEIDAELVEAAQQLADDFELPVEFIHGSFIPRGSDACLGAANEFSWLTIDEDAPSAELGPDDFDVIFAYPWPDEEHVIDALFKRHARPGAVLVSYHGGADVRVQRLMRKHKKRGMS